MQSWLYQGQCVWASPTGRTGFSRHAGHVRSGSKRRRRNEHETRAGGSDRRSAFAEALAEAVVSEHRESTLSLVVCNTVLAAQQAYEAVIRKYNGASDVVLLTSHFRAQDRKSNQRKLLSFEAVRKCSTKDRSVSVTGLICVSTQVIEAGVDISARRLWSEVAPWPSTIQRLGRLNRDGEMNGDAHAYFWERPEISTRGVQRVGPYEAEAVKLGKQLVHALVAVHQTDDVPSAHDALAKLSAADETKGWVEEALTPRMEPCPRAIDVHGLFSTEPDVFGGFTDVSPFVRSRDGNADVTVFWREWSSNAQLRRSDELAGPAFRRDEACQVGLGSLREFLSPSGSAWVWDEKRETWEHLGARELRPGMLAMLRRADGGYSRETGWTARKADKLDEVPPPGEPHERFEDDRYSESGFWITLPDHLLDAAREATHIVRALELHGSDVGSAVIHASTEHDIGKALPQWQGALPKPGPQSGAIWAKAPYQFAVTADVGEAALVTETTLRSAGVRHSRAGLWTPQERNPGKRFEWHVERKLGRTELDQIRAARVVKRAWNVPFRPCLRHEAATALALWYSYYRQENRGFVALTIYLAAAHHGKVRTVLTSRTDAGDDVCGIQKTTDSLPWNDMPLDFECAFDGASGDFSEDGSAFIFKAPGWTGLVHDLLGGWEPDAAQGVSGAVPEGEPRNLGPFVLAYLESLVRCSDVRASKNPSAKTDIAS